MDALKWTKRKTLANVITVADFMAIHNIGKSIVCTLLTVKDFEVHDLGVNIKAEEFIEAI